MDAEVKYKCNTCMGLFDRKEDAAMCCAPEIVFQCGHCEETHDVRQYAEQCCAPEEES